MKPKEPAPRPQEPEDTCHFRLQNTFSETRFVFLASVITNLYNRIWAGFPVGAGGGAGSKACSRRACASGKRSSEGTVLELCPASCLGVPRWALAQPLRNTIFPSVYAPRTNVADAEESSSHLSD